MHNLTDKEILQEFFDDLNRFGQDYIQWTKELPKTLVVNPDIIGKLSRLDGFYQREEIKNVEVTAASPVVRRMNLAFGIVFLDEDWDEKFMHFE
jgi:hypothetical protein